MEQPMQNYLQYVSQPNPIQKRTLVEPLSIFAQLPLPNFTFIDQQQQTISTQPSSIKQTFQLQKKQLTELFQSPIYCSSSKLHFATIRIRGQQSRIHSPLMEQQIEKRSQIVFQSRFESGNLAFAAKSQRQRQYYLLLRKDFNTRKCIQWFFFRVTNVKKIGSISFHILNFTKSYSTYENGMKVAYASSQNGYKWSRGCSDIKYRKTNISYDQKKKYYCLSFTYNFKNSNQIVYFAYSYPYTFTMLDRFLFHISENYDHIVKRKTIGQSIGKNYIDLLTITNHSTPTQKKRVIFITARVHPGQSPSSFIMEGLIRYLISKSPQAELLRDNFIFKLIPMLNPDGVINGNYRCSLNAYDLNRVWNFADRDRHPQIFAAKKSVQLTKNMFMFLDLHAHSKKKGLFVYGCQSKNAPYLCRHIPYLFWKNVTSFNYFQCNFKIQEERQGTSRITVWKMCNTDYVYTLQTSFCGPVKEKVHFTVKNYLNFGLQIAHTIQRYYCRRKNINGVEQILKEEDIFKQLYADKELLTVGNDENQSSSSDSQLQQIPKLQFQVSLTLKKQKKSNSQKKQKNIDREFPKKDFLGTTCRYKEGSSQKYMPNKLKFQKLSLGNRIQQFSVPIVYPGLKEQYITSSPKGRKNIRAFSSFAEKKGFEIKLQQQIAGPYRYIQQQANQLSNLFLPSLTKSNYRKYAKKNGKSKQVMSFGHSFNSQTHIKQEIKSVEKRKPTWREQIKNIL